MSVSADPSGLGRQLAALAVQATFVEPEIAVAAVRSKGARRRRRARITAASATVGLLAVATAAVTVIVIPSMSRPETATVQSEPSQTTSSPAAPTRQAPHTPPLLPPAVRNGPVSRNLAALVASRLAGYSATRLTDQPIDCGTAASAEFTSAAQDLVVVQTQCESRPFDPQSWATTNGYALTTLNDGSALLSLAAPGRPGTGGFVLVMKQTLAGRLTSVSAYGAPGRPSPLTIVEAEGLLPAAS